MAYNSYSKRPLWQWILIYVVVAIILYGAIYYFFLRNNNPYSANTSYNNNSTTTGNIGINTTASDTIKIATADQIGQYLTDKQGMSLYYFTKDTQGNGKSACYDQCANLWPAFYTDSVLTNPPLGSSDFSFITRTDGKKQLTYKGWPLYYYAKDTKIGDVTGENVGGVWFAMRP